MMHVSRLSVMYIGPEPRTARPRKTKISTEVAHALHDSRSKGQRSAYRGSGILWWPPAQLVGMCRITQKVLERCALNFGQRQINYVLTPLNEMALGLGSNILLLNTDISRGLE